jgi:2-polyprenyl-3-methyl-5-hydroxy-6-metoxy-1,4-benzoquinol methylase
MEYKLLEVPRDYDKEWHEPRPVADHIHEPVQRERLLLAIEYIRAIFEVGPNVRTVMDIACGNGGLLWELRKRLHADAILQGVDLSEANVEWARDKYGVDAWFMDITKDLPPPADIGILTEILEHLVDPRDLLRRIHRQYRWLVASCPAYETPDQHYEFHNWAWTDESYPQMFKECGYEVVKHFVDGIATQFVVARPMEVLK